MIPSFIFSPLTIPENQIRQDIILKNTSDWI